jgi:hypothetical protein
MRSQVMIVLTIEHENPAELERAVSRALDDEALEVAVAHELPRRRCWWRCLVKPVHRSTFGSRYFAHRLYQQARSKHGVDHVATRAALGRLYACRDTCFALDDIGRAYLKTDFVASLAFHRESGNAGYLNRTHRKNERRKLRAALAHYRAAPAAAEGT